MELHCESEEPTEDRRPASCKVVELHVLLVPDDQWNMRLNKVPADAIESFISAGFIRVVPDTSLKTLRSELAALLGTERSVDRFSFLKCVGRSLAVVKSKQERELKVKTFAPPYAAQPELYLLPAVENDSSVCSSSPSAGMGNSSSSSSSSSSSISSPEQPSRDPPQKTAKEPVKFPSSPSVPSSLLPLQAWTRRRRRRRKSKAIVLQRQRRKMKRRVSPQTSQGGASETFVRGRFRIREQHSLQHRGKHREADAAQVKETTEREGKKKRQNRASRAARDSGVAPSLEDTDSGFSLTDGTGKSKHLLTLKSIRNKAVTEGPAALPPPVTCTSPPPAQDLEVTPKSSACPIFQTNREELMEEIKLVREERKRLEWTRQELLRKGKDLLAQNRHRRNQARDSWKKKYFETKKATVPLEESLRNLRQELETFYNKLLHQLQARDSRGKPRRPSRSSMKNELIIHILTESYEIDDLRRKVEDAKMKLVTEIKLRTQAATELRALKAELAQKKSQSSYPAHSTREKRQTQSTFI